MAKYDIEVVETLSRVVTAEGNNYEEALDAIEKKYNNTEIVLGYEDLEDTDYKPYPSQRLKENCVITVEYKKKDKSVYITTKESSETNYPCKTIEDLKSAINTYISNYIEVEPVSPLLETNPKDKSRDER